MAACQMCNQNYKADVLLWQKTGPFMKKMYLRLVDRVPGQQGVVFLLQVRGSEEITVRHSGLDL